MPNKKLSKIADKKVKKLMAEIEKDRNDPCDMCGKVNGWGLAASHTCFRTKSKNRLWANMSYDLKLTIPLLGDKSSVKVAKVCHTCHRNILIMLTWREIYDITVGKLWWWVKEKFNGLNPLTHAFIMNGIVILILLGLQKLGVLN